LEDNLKDKITEALKPYFKGRGAPSRLDAAVESVLAVLPKPESQPKQKLGVTVMTEKGTQNL
jgi:hypothetical protein